MVTRWLQDLQIITVSWDHVQQQGAGKEGWGRHKSSVQLFLPSLLSFLPSLLPFFFSFTLSFLPPSLPLFLSFLSFLPSFPERKTLAQKPFSTLAYVSY